MSYRIEDLHFSYDENEPVIQSLNFDLNENEIFCILGPSGCGKTTLLKLLAGLLEPKSGQIDPFFQGDKSFLFQEPRLLPWYTVYENLVFTTESHMTGAEMATAIDHYLKAVRLWDYKDHYPDELSGGMQQRIAIVRGFLSPANLMLLDEPFKSLDIEIKLSVMETFKNLWRERPKTVVMITHDAMAASLLGDRIMVLSEKPTRAVDTLKNPVPKEERRIQNPEVGQFQSQLYSYFVDM